MLFYIPVLAVVFGVVNMPSERRLRRCTISASVGPSFWPKSGQCLRSHWRTHQRASHTKPEIKKIAKYWEKVPNLNLDLEKIWRNFQKSIIRSPDSTTNSETTNTEVSWLFLTNRVVSDYKTIPNKQSRFFFTKICSNLVKKSWKCSW